MRAFLAWSFAHLFSRAAERALLHERFEPQGEENVVSDLFSVRDKIAVVTGGSRGIGAMIARGLVEAGAKVYVSARKADACDALAAELSKIGSCLSIAADVGDEAGVAHLAGEVAKRESALHILVNNAGANWGAPYAEFPDAAWDKVLAVNLKGVFHLTRALTPLLEAGAKPGDPARVINIGSIDGIRVPPLETYAYSASKAGVHHLTRTLAKRLAPKITVNAVAPGPFESKMMAETIRRFKDAIIAACPMGRIGEPEDMAGVVIYLASRAGAYVTGSVIVVDGGMSGCS
jgi:NAD(P)-dependent dehydrogenase (short-subunit alcohol dehydrogenase family)